MVHHGISQGTHFPLPSFSVNQIINEISTSIKHFINILWQRKKMPSLLVVELLSPSVEDFVGKCSNIEMTKY